jgi:hypothetical protein
MPPRAIPIKEAKDPLTGLVRQAAKGARLTISVHGQHRLPDPDSAGGYRVMGSSPGIRRRPHPARARVMK